MAEKLLDFGRSLVTAQLPHANAALRYLRGRSDLRGAQPNWDLNKLTIKTAPSPREVFWIGTFVDSLEPEFTGYHPGVIVSGAKTVRENVETVKFVPLTSEEPQKGATGKYPPYVYELSDNPSPSDRRKVWAICDHVMTVRLTRLERYLGPTGLFVPKISKDDFDGILDAIANGMTALRSRFDHKTKIALDALKIEHDALMSALKAQHESEFDAKALAYLECLTDPNA
ncbi:hypothetical protein HFO33_32560 [Rhizobium leguminosarum]|uniref:type II toxin-antitoxin system PemK/MazF family toxin n=1 Tax=Rhizobium leguminosarum TaxID=384 RepID=UPI001C983CE9|nr:type II toxin-antitoxin system PemK/MazF family toxin [Rhizobium leguminosarum]MBY5721237.1 hypothetical protein [Rhizobium leguminosarum]